MRCVLDNRSKVSVDSLVDLNGSSFISVFPETFKRYPTANFKKAWRLMMLFTLLDSPLIS